MIRLLILAANPRNTSPLRLGEEVREIESKLRVSSAGGGFRVQSAWAVTVDELMYQLNSFQPNIIHFSGHGTEAGQLVLEDASGESRPLSPDGVQLMFANFKQWLQVVVLNACYSDHQAKALAENADAVVGMGASIGDSAAITFAASFYRALGFGRTVEEAYSQAVASLMLEGIGNEDVPVLTHRPGVDPKQLRLAGTSDVAQAIRRVEDPRVPSRLRDALRAGSELLILSNEDLRLSTPGPYDEDVIFLCLRMRQSSAKYVVEVSRHALVSDVAKLVARRLLPSTDVHFYDWTLIKEPREQLAEELSLAMSNLKSGDWVKLVGNHRQPTWAPKMAPSWKRW